MLRPRFNLGVVLASAVSLGLAVLVLLPVIVVVVSSILPGSWTGAAVELRSAGAGTRTISDAFAYLLAHYGTWLEMSGWIAALSVAIGLFAAVPAGYVFVRYPFPGSRLLEELVLLPLSLPGIALSVALLTTYPGARGSVLVLSGHLLYTLPFFVRAVTSVLRTRDIAELEAAARVLGAGFVQRFLWIVLPILRPALVLGALIVFTVSWGEFNVSFLLNSGQPQTFPAALYNTYANESFQRSSAATVLFLAGVAPALLAIQWLGGLRSEDVERGA
jgi:putative spermidine/putrescine transport system permease protein